MIATSQRHLLCHHRSEQLLHLPSRFMRTAELYHELVPFNADLAQRMSDRAVRILQATDAGELLPCIARDRDHIACRMCAYAQRCWSLPS